MQDPIHPQQLPDATQGEARDVRRYGIAAGDNLGSSRDIGCQDQ